MQESTSESISFPMAECSTPGIVDPLTDVLRRGAQRLLVDAVEAEVSAWIDARQHITDADGRRQVVRNGYAEPRTVVTGVGPMSVKMPRVHDRRPAEAKERFTSSILPPYLRKAKTIDALIPWLYLKGVSTGGFGRGIAGVGRPGLQGAVGHDGDATDRQLAGRAGGVVEA